MAQVGTVEVVATIDTSRYKRGARDIESANKGIEGSVDKSDSSLGKLNKRLNGMARTGLKVATGGFIALAGTITAMTIGGGISRALNIEDAQAKLKGLGHDVKGVEAIMESALGAVKGTAFGLDAAATTAASAVAAGIKPGKELTKYLTLTADAATIAGVEMSEMGSIINKVTTSGKAYADNLNQLADRGIPIFQWLQDEYKVSAEELSKMVRKGEVDAATFRKVIEKNIGGAALESGATTRGAWKNLLAAMSRVGAAIVSGPMDDVKRGFGDMTKWIDRNADTIVNIVHTSMRMVGTALVNIANTLKTLAPVIASAAVAWTTYKGAVIAVNTVQKLQAMYAAATATQYMLLNGTLITVRTATVAQTIAQTALNTVMKLSPIGLVVGAIAGITTAYMLAKAQTDNTKSATDRLNEARREEARAADAAKDANNRLKDAHLTSEGSALAVERAQRSYNDTVKMYGPNSLEAREAAYQLKRAEDDLKRANDDVRVATDEKQRKEQEVADKREVTKKAEAEKRSAINQTKDVVWQQNDALSNLGLRLDQINGRTVSYSVVGQITDQESAKKAGYKSGAPFKRYKGGPVRSGQPYVVGENPDGSLNSTSELFVPNSSGRIINAQDFQSALSGGGKSVEYNIGTITIASEVDGERWLRRLSGNQEIVSNGLVPTQSYM